MSSTKFLYDRTMAIEATSGRSKRDFGWALEQMREGWEVTRNSGQDILKLSGRTIYTAINGRWESWTPTHADLLATDWGCVY
jgi:hypothetical protein